jgi:hypothetical protein
MIIIFYCDNTFGTVKAFWILLEYINEIQKGFEEEITVITNKELIDVFSDLYHFIKMTDEDNLHCSINGLENAIRVILLKSPLKGSLKGPLKGLENAIIYTYPGIKFPDNNKIFYINYSSPLIAPFTNSGLERLSIRASETKQAKFLHRLIEPFHNEYYVFFMNISIERVEGTISYTSDDLIDITHEEYFRRGLMRL